MYNSNDPVIGQHWGPPAGGLDESESIYDCAHREFFEETGAKASNIRLAYVQQYTDAETNTAGFLFVASDMEGTPSVQGEGGRDSEWFEELVWLGRDDLADKRILPPFLKDRFFDDCETGFESPIYLPRSVEHPAGL
jgi:8-oxo-dGTP pyrophosphatase MutT (NUDIX family)